MHKLKDSACRAGCMVAAGGGSGFLRMRAGIQENTQANYAISTSFQKPLSRSVTLLHARTAALQQAMPCRFAGKSSTLPLELLPCNLCLSSLPFTSYSLAPRASKMAGCCAAHQVVAAANAAPLGPHPSPVPHLSSRRWCP